MEKATRVIIGGLVVTLVLAVVALSVWCVRLHEHNAYHQSQAAMNARWAELTAHFPPCSTRTRVLDEFRLSAEDIEREGDIEVLEVRVPLSIRAEAYRDYRGFAFEFFRGALTSISPIGPDGAGVDVPLPRMLGDSGQGPRGACRKP